MADKTTDVSAVDFGAYVPVLSKVKIGNTYYYLKDREAREELAELEGRLGDAAYLDSTSEVSGASADALPTSAAVKSYVDAQVASIEIGDVVIDSASASGAPATTPSADTYRKLYLVPDGDDVEAGAYIEWLTIRSGSEGSYSYAWESIGTTKIDLTNYYTKSEVEGIKVAGATLGNDLTIAASEMADALSAADALNLGALSHKDTATATVTDYVTGANDVTVTAAGTVAVGTTVTATAATFTGNYTPAGEVTGSAISGGSISVTLTDGAVTTATLTRADYTPAGTVEMRQDNDAGTQIAGTVSAPTITLTSAPQAVLTAVATAGTVPSFTNGTIGTFVEPAIQSGFYTDGRAASLTGATFTAPSLTAASVSKFAVNGLVATVGESGDDAECLIFSDASTEDAVTDRGTFTAGAVDFGTFDGGAPTTIDTSKFVAGSWTPGTFNAGAMPTFSDGSVNNVTAASAAAPVFTGDKYAFDFAGTSEAGLKVTEAKYLLKDVASADFTPVAATLGFSGTAATISTSGDYDKVSVTGATFTGTAVTAPVTLTTGNKTITVS